MKICQLIAIPNHSSGGLGKHFVELSNELSRQVETVAICHPDYGDYLSDSVRHSPLNMTGSRYSPIVLWRLWSILKQERPDIVHAHGNKAAELLAYLKPVLPCACVGTIHWHLKRKKNRRGYERMDAVVGVSKAVLKEIKNPVKTVIYNGVKEVVPESSRSALRARFGLTSECSTAIAIGRLTSGKGFDVLLDAWRGIEANLLLVGDGPLLPSLKKQASSLGLRERVRFTGFVKDATHLFPAADLVVISSRQEGFSYVMAEALIHRKPIVSTAVSGPKEILPKDMLVEPGDAGALHQQLIYALENLPELTDRLSNTFDWAKDHLTLDAMVRDNLALYKRICH